MTDLSTIPIEELLEDRAASVMDMRTCERLLPGASMNDIPRLQERIDGNAKIIAIIDAEQRRRMEADK